MRALIVVNSGNTPADRERDVFGDPLERMWRDCVLTYCGVGHVMRALFGVVATSTAEQRHAWLEDAGRLATEAVRRAKAD